MKGLINVVIISHILNDDGTFKNKEECIESCESQFIGVQLKKAQIQKECLQYYHFIKKIINTENMNVYIKGGNVIGLAVLKLIYNKFRNNDIKFTKAFKGFLELELIKDWDFASYTNGKEITEKYREKLDKIALEFQLVPRAKTFVLYQTKKPILIYEKALFEIAVLCSDDNEFSKMEIPLTTMKVKVSPNNLKYIFIMAKNFYSWKTKNIPIDLDIIKKVMSKITILIHPHKRGFYDLSSNSIDKGDLTDNLVKFIKVYSNGDPLVTQFLITHTLDPYRLIYRMEEKNMEKSKKIQNFINKYLEGLEHPKWLLNVEKTKKIIDGFVVELGKKILDIYKKENKNHDDNNYDDKINNLNKVFEFLEGVATSNIKLDIS